MIDNKKFKSLISINGSVADNKIVSHYTSPLYLANLALVMDNQIECFSPSVVNNLKFKVLEQPLVFDKVASDRPPSPDELSVSDKVEMLAK